MTRAVLTIAGSDSGGGAGIQADIKTISALGVYAASAVTAVTAQNTRGVTAVQALPSGLIRAQIDAVMQDIAIDAIKIGMIGGAPAMAEVASALRDCSMPVVLDPVMIAKSGDVLMPDDAVGTLIRLLVPLACVLTPNLPEAARLLDTRQAETEAEMIAQGKALHALGATHVLMKGGHAEGADCTDILIGPDGIKRFTSPRIRTHNTHGTGCSLSSALAAGLAHGLPVFQAARMAHDWLHAAILGADGLGIGAGHGPVHHFHALWPMRGEAAE